MTSTQKTVVLFHLKIKKHAPLQHPLNSQIQMNLLQHLPLAIQNFPRGFLSHVDEKGWNVNDTDDLTEAMLLGSPSPQPNIDTIGNELQVENIPEKNSATPSKEKTELDICPQP